MKRTIHCESFDNVWDALASSPEEAVNLTIRCQLMLPISSVVKSWNVPQAEAARRLGITRPHLNDLLRGKLSKFSLDMLATLAGRAGLTVRMSVKKAA